MKRVHLGSTKGAAVIFALAVITFTLWVWPRTDAKLHPRIPGTDAAPTGVTAGGNPVQAGKVIPGPGQPVPLPGGWPQFRGALRDGCAGADANVTADWTAVPPRELWGLDVGEGYAGVAIRAGRVYLMDYDRDTQQSSLRCLSLADGREFWRFSYPLVIKRNHGMTRTVPVVTDQYVVALDSKCHAFCLNATNGALQWTIDLVREFSATVPEWYAGQCPLVVSNQVILAPGGKDALLVAVDLASGRPLWQTPNPHEWKMTHASIMPMAFAGRRLYVYCASKGVVGVAAEDGRLLWENSEWKISIATVPSPLPLPGGRIFLTGGYNAGSLMLQLAEQGGQMTAQPLFKLGPEVFGATQHTPVAKGDFLYGARADGRFVCLALDGKVRWTSGSGENFGLGAFLLAGEDLLALNDSGKLSRMAASPEAFQLRGQAQVLHGRESWAPMALAGNRLLVRDLTRLVCLDVGGK